MDAPVMGMLKRKENISSTKDVTISTNPMMWSTRTTNPIASADVLPCRIFACSEMEETTPQPNHAVGVKGDSRNGEHKHCCQHHFQNDAVGHRDLSASRELIFLKEQARTFSPSECAP
jgi:hypothetical protein